jgi:hypothetical protein
MKLELWKIKNFARNLWTFKRALYEYASWDYSGTLRLMETAFKDMSESHKNHSQHLCQDRKVRELIILSELCKRLREDDYGMDCSDFSGGYADGMYGVRVEGKFPVYGTKSYWEDIENIKKNDLNLLTKMLNRKLLTFWH